MHVLGVFIGINCGYNIIMIIRVKVNGEIAKTSGGTVNRTNIVLIVTDGGLTDTGPAIEQVAILLMYT